MKRRISERLLDYLVDRLRPASTTKVGGFGPMLLFAGQNVVKLFRPSTKVRFGSHMIDGDFGLFVGRPPQNASQQSRIRAPDSLTLSPMMNYPELVGESHIKNDRVSDAMIRMITAQLNKIPDTIKALHAHLGSDYFEMAPVERLIILTQYLRSMD